MYRNYGNYSQDLVPRVFRAILTTMRRMLRAILFLVLATAAIASETLNALVDSASTFSAAIEQQLEAATQSDPAPADFAQRTVAHARAKIAYYDALRVAMPELIDIASGRKPRPPDMDRFTKAFNRGRRDPRDRGRRCYR